MDSPEGQDVPPISGASLTLPHFDEEDGDRTGHHHPPRRTFHRGNVVGLKDVAGKRSSVFYRRQEFLNKHHSSMDTLPAGLTPEATKTIEEKERLAREGEITNPLYLLFLSNLAAIKVMFFYLITAETIFTCMLTAGMIMYWYDYGLEDHEGTSRSWSGGGMDFVVLVFAVTSPVNILCIRSMSQYHIILNLCILMPPILLFM